MGAAENMPWPDGRNLSDTIATGPIMAIDQGGFAAAQSYRAGQGIDTRHG